MRRLLTESANAYSRGIPGVKSKVLKARQKDKPQNVIAYSDRANIRLRKKYMRLAEKSGHNVATTAVARELSCFIWGMMNDVLS